MLELRNIFLSRGGQGIFENFNCHFGSGGRHLLLGANGAGKTSLLELCCGLLTPDRGSVLFQGDPLARLSMGQITYASELPIVFPELSVAENLALRIRLTTDASPRSDLERIVTKFGLQSVLRKKVHGLSRGFKKRLSLALSLLISPTILLCDEPTTGLDDLGAEILRAALAELPEQALCIIVTHEPEFFVGLGFHTSVLCEQELLAISDARILDTFRNAGAEQGQEQ
jgi:ABC-type multidrug transport system ATPase subunit